MIALLLACTSEAPPEATAASFTDPEAPWLGAEPDDGVSIDLAVVTGAIETAYAALDQIDPDPLLTVYDAALADSAPGCPAFYTAEDGFGYWLDDCEAPSGARFEGFGVGQVDTDVPFDQDLFGTTTTIGGSGTMVAADGTTLTMNGFVQLSEASSPGLTFESLVVSGTFSTDAPGAGGTWLAQGWEPEVTVVRYELPGGGRVRTATGVLEGLSVDGSVVPVVLQDVAVAEEATNLSDCADEPTGVVSVRIDGDWVDVIFDPVAIDGGIATEPGLCDGCGEAWSGVTSLGPVCPDVGALFGDQAR
ncbi:MAG: hypothetical protein AAF602_09345 [Myxococcota bacterium]